MSYSIGLVLSLIGSAAACAALAAGDALRREDESFLQRITARLLIALFFLPLACAAGVGNALRSPAATWFPDYLAVSVLTSGVGAIVWAFLRAPRWRGDESFSERITFPGKVGLGLLALAQLLDLVHGKVGEALQPLRTQAGFPSLILGVLGVSLMVLGTAAAAATFRFGPPLRDGAGSVLKRLNPVARGTLVILALALAVAGLVNLVAPTAGSFLSFVLLALGTGLGVLGYCLDNQAAAPPERVKWGISSRGWIALGLVGMAGAVSAADQATLLTARRAPVQSAVRNRDEPAGHRELEQMRALVARTEAELAPPKGSPTSPDAVDMARYGKQGPAVDARERSDPSNAAAKAPSTIDLSKWRPGSTAGRYGN